MQKPNSLNGVYDILDILYDKKEDDDLLELKDVNLQELELELSKLEDKIDNFIDTRIHPKSREKLKDLLSKYNHILYLYHYRENQLIYKNGISDGMDIIISSFSLKNKKNKENQ